MKRCNISTTFALFYTKIRRLRQLLYNSYLPPNPMHDDIYLVEFPKSGVTWLQHLIGNIELQLAKKNEIITFYNFHKYLPDIHQLKGANIQRHFERTFIKSHSLYNPYYYFVIYLVRNPYDVMVSYYNFLLHKGYEKTFESFVKDKRVGILAWRKHVSSWIHKKIEAQRMMIIKYENLISSTRQELKNIYLNLGLDLPEEIIKNAIQSSTIENMRRSEEHYRLYNPNYTMSFVGKRGKLDKDRLITCETEKYIYNCTRQLIEELY